MFCNTCRMDMIPVVYDLHQCPDCGLISSDLKPDPSLYDKSYLRKYERYEETEAGKDLNGMRVGLVRSHTECSAVLDFGCGSGAFVRHCMKHGIEAVGFDINPNSPYCDVANLFNGHSVVTLWDSLEHLEDPKTVVNGLGGEYLFVSTPSTDDFDGGDLTGWHHYYPEEHIHYYNDESLSRLFEECGYEVTFRSYGESRYRRSGSGKNIITMGGVNG